MKRLTAKEQEELLLAVGGLLTNAEDPTKVTTNTAMCGRLDLQNVHRVWKKCFDKATARSLEAENADFQMKGNHMKVFLRIDRMKNGDMIVFTKTGKKWIRHGVWYNDQNVVRFDMEIELSDAASSTNREEK